MQTGNLINKFDLAEEVDEFVRRRVAELLGERKNGFSFSGSPGHCGNSKPHIPHTVGQYNTVRYGWLENYCSGSEGDGLHIVVTSSSRGSAETPGRLRGYWFQESPLAASEAV